MSDFQPATHATHEPTLFLIHFEETLAVCYEPAAAITASPVKLLSTGCLLIPSKGLRNDL